MISPAPSSARSLLEVDPATGAKLDYLRVARQLEAIRTRVERESGGRVSVHIIGFAMAMGAVARAPAGVLILLACRSSSPRCWSAYYAGRWKLSGAPVLCSLVAVVVAARSAHRAGVRHRPALDPRACSWSLPSA